MELEGIVCIGLVTGAHGIKGELRVHPYNPDSSLPTRGMEVFLVDREGRPAPFVVANVRRGPRKLILRLESISDRDAAEAVRGMELAVEEADLPPLGEDEFYYRDVVGLPVRTEDGTDVGHVTEVFRTGTDVIVVQGTDREFMVPVVDEFVTKLGPDEVVVTAAAMEPPA